MPRLLPLLLLLLFPACQGDAPAEVPPGTWTETLRLGGEAASDTAEHVIGFVSDAATDADGTIYLADGQQHAIHVYDAGGTYQRSFGGAGEGPGEFQTISALHVDRQGRLLVADAQNDRISVFAPDGELLATHANPIAGRIGHLTALPDGRFLLVGLADGHLVHVVDEDFQAVEAQLVEAETMRDPEEPLARVVQQFFPGRAAALGEGALLYAPFAYDGRLYAYREQPDGTWVSENVLEGYAYHEEPVSFSPIEEAERVHLPITLQGQGRYAAQFHGASRGLFAHPGGGAVHLSAHERGDASVLLVEQFNAEGQLTRHFTPDTLALEDVVALEGVWLDHAGRLYLTDHREWPTLRQLRFEE